MPTDYGDVRAALAQNDPVIAIHHALKLESDELKASAAMLIEAYLDTRDPHLLTLMIWRPDLHPLARLEPRAIRVEALHWLELLKEGIQVCSLSEGVQREELEAALKEFEPWLFSHFNHDWDLQKYGCRDSKTRQFQVGETDLSILYSMKYYKNRWGDKHGELELTERLIAKIVGYNWDEVKDKVISGWENI